MSCGLSLQVTAESSTVYQEREGSEIIERSYVKAQTKIRTHWIHLLLRGIHTIPRICELAFQESTPWAR